MDLLAANTTGFHYGVKLVRGAYMEQERDLSIIKGKDVPVVIVTLSLMRGTSLIRTLQNKDTSIIRTPL